jgi:carbamoyltransferase
MLILGLGPFDRGSSVALFDSNSILAAIEEEKLTRLYDSSDLPRLALTWTLEHSGVKPSDLELVALSHTSEGSCVPWEGHSLSELPVSEVRDLLQGCSNAVLFDHHLCHAASAFYTCDFDRALVLTLDEGLPRRSGLIALGEGDDIKPLLTLCSDSSLGWFYSRVTELLGLRAHRDERKVQWLSKDGTSDFLPAFRKLFCRDQRGLPVLSRRYFDGKPGCCSEFRAAMYRDLGLRRSDLLSDSSLRAAIARSAQEVLEEVVLELANRFGRETGSDSLCLAGGIFENVLLVRALETRSIFRNVYVQPVAGNSGTALGAGFLGRKRITQRSGRARLQTLALGPCSTAEQIKSTLDNCKIVYRYLPVDQHLRDETSRLLLEDKIVAWYHGRTEFGNRALGNRSILASPFSEYVIENVNDYVKRREAFHPFALSVPAERASEFFHCGPNCSFMASLGSMDNTVRGLERFAFNGGTVRVHAVEREANPAFWKLLHKFGESAPAPILVNTSFNLFGEPLVADPRSAVRSLYSSGLDALAIGPFLVVK